MDGRPGFSGLALEENLLTGASTRRDGRAATKEDLETVNSYFPKLRKGRKSRAGCLSGSEQQRCAIGRPSTVRPKVILPDEPATGPAPQLVEEIFDIVGRLNRDSGVTPLVGEQNTSIARSCAGSGRILENGRVVLDGDTERLKNKEDVQEFYLGPSSSGRRSFRDVKSYKHRKRWL